MGHGDAGGGPDLRHGAGADVRGSTADNVDTVKIVGKLPSEISVSRRVDQSGNLTNDLVLKINGTTDQLTLQNYFVAGSAYKVEKVQFDDGTMWDMALLGSAAIMGTAAANTLSGSADADLIQGLEANDTLSGNAGNDIMQGGADNDTISDTSGNNLFDGGAGIDILTGGSGKELFIGGAANDTITTGLGADIIDADQRLGGLTALSKFNAEWAFLRHLHEIGRAAASEWLDKHYESIGERSTVNVRSLFT
ncbi:MAG: calcium-binding protein [Gammaproteobacteria bacterium]